MTTFTLDTSDAVEPSPPFDGCACYLWPDLDPFAQGTLTAASEEASRVLGRRVAFSDWSFEALEAILADCVQHRRSGRHPNWTADGRQFWEHRQRGSLAAFPPLTPTLGDDGKVRLSTIERAEAGR